MSVIENKKQDKIKLILIADLKIRHNMSLTKEYIEKMLGQPISNFQESAGANLGKRFRRVEIVIFTK